MAETPPNDSNTGASPLLSPEDLKSILASSGAADGQPITGLWNGPTSPFSFSSAGLAQSDQFQKIMNLHAGVALQIEKHITRVTKETFRCECTGHEVLQGKDIISATNTDNDLVLFWQTPELGLEGFHLIPRAFFFSYFNSLFGGNRAFVKKGTLTSLEESYLNKLMLPFFEYMSKGWEHIGKLNVATKHILTDQEHINRIRWNFDCVKATFKLQWKDIEGQWTFIGPKDFLKSLVTSEEEGTEESSKDKLWAEAVWGAIHDTLVAVRAELGAITVPLQKVLSLQVGDTFNLHLSSEGHPVFVADKLTYQVSVGSMEGHRAVKVNEVLKEAVNA